MKRIVALGVALSALGFAAIAAGDIFHPECRIVADVVKACIAAGRTSYEINGS